MRKRQITQTGQADLLRNYDHIAREAPRSAELYYTQALRTFEEFPDDLRTPPQASDLLPSSVRVLHLGSPFRGYTLFVEFAEDTLYLIAAFAPGLTDAQKSRRGSTGLRDI